MKNLKPLLVLGGLGAAAFALGRRSGADIANRGRLANADGFFYYEIGPSADPAAPIAVFLSVPFVDLPPEDRDPMVEMSPIASVESEEAGREFIQGYAERVL